MLVKFYAKEMLKIMIVLSPRWMIIMWNLMIIINVVNLR